MNAKWKRAACAVLLAALIAAPAKAYIGLTTAPERDEVQLTIYNAADLTLVRERRTLSFKKGDNELEFSWVNTLIDPTSIQLEFPSGGEGLQVADITFPRGRGEALVWHVKAAKETAAPVDVSYFTSGIAWEADYVALLNESETAVDLEGWVKASNRSGETYENAKTRLVVGSVRLVEPVAELAQKYRDRAAPGYGGAVPDYYPAAAPEAEMMEMQGAMLKAVVKAEMKVAPKEIAKEAVSELYLYTIEGTETIPDQGAKRMISLKKSGVPVEMTYKLDPEKYGPALLQFITTKNDKKSKLGEEPLPEGMFRVLKIEKGGKKAFLGQTNLEYVPVNEDVEIDLGEDPEVSFEEKPMDFKRVNLHYDKEGRVDGFTTVQTMEFKVKNAKKTPAKFEIRRQLDGDWTVETAEKYEKIDQRTVEFKFRLEPFTEKTVRYVVTRKEGRNS